MYYDFTQEKRKARFSLLFVPLLGSGMEFSVKRISDSAKNAD